jgi:hypothetical protein
VSFEIRKATRQSARLVIALYGLSGSGKSFSALLLARGIAGDGKVVMIDSESGRGEAYADEIPGGYDVLPLDPPFSPARYVEAIEAAEKAGAKVIVIDSVSHEWENTGGVLDMAGANEGDGKKGLAVWKGPKIEHSRLVLKMQQSSATIIVCLRAKYKNRQVKQNGKTEIVRDEFLSPIQSDDFIFETTVHFEIQQDHTVIMTKPFTPALNRCFPDDRAKPFTVETGKAVAEWAKGGNAGRSQEPEKPKQDAGLVALKKELWDLTKPVHKGDTKALEAFLITESFIDESESLATLTVQQIRDIITKMKGAQ